MLTLRRKVVQAAGRTPTAASCGARRYASGEHGAAEDAAHHGDHGHHSAPKAELMGPGFFIALGAIPLSIGVYVFSRPDKDGNLPSFTKFINSYSHYQEKYAARNALHTAAVEQAAFDRNLFQSSKGSPHVDLRFPEIFNNGSPFNIVAGQGARGMDELVAHYEKQNAEAEENKVKRAEKRAEAAVAREAKR